MMAEEQKTATFPQRSGRDQAALAFELIERSSQDVTAVDIINQVFPNEESLQDIDSCLALMDERLEFLDGEIKAGLREAACTAQTRDGTTPNVQAFKSATHLLTEEIKSISERIQQTRAQTDEIAREIYTLDRGRENITYVIACLHRLVMLQSALQSLRSLAGNREYGKCIELIQATESLAKFFTQDDEVPVDGSTTATATIPQINSLLEEKTQLFLDIRRQISDEIQTAIDESDEFDRSEHTHCRDCCLAADAIQSGLRNEILMRLALKILEPYRRNFTFMPSSAKKEERKQDALSALQATDKRLIWLKRSLDDCRQRYGGSSGAGRRTSMFPEEWRFEQFVCQQFALITRQHLITLLELCCDTLDPQTLLDIIRRVKEMEKFLEDQSGSSSASSSSSLGKQNRTISFKRSITRIFDSFLSGWYMQKDAFFFKLLSSFESEPDEVTALAGDTTSISNYNTNNNNNTLGPPSQEPNLPRRIYRSVLELFGEIKKTHMEAQIVESSQMSLDVMKLTKKALSMYLDILSLGRKPTHLVNVLIEKPSLQKGTSSSSTTSSTLHLTKYICTHVLQIGRLGFIAGLDDHPHQHESTDSLLGGWSSQASKSPWIAGLMRGGGERKMKLKNVREIDDVGELCTIIATISFIEESLPSLESMLTRGIGGHAEKNDAADERSSLLNLRVETDRAWELRHSYFLLACVHFTVAVMEPELSLKYQTWRKQLPPQPPQVESKSPWMNTFLAVWQEWASLTAQFLSERMQQLLFDCCATLVVAELTNLICTQLPPFDSNTPLTSQLLLDLSTLIDGLATNFPTMYIDVAKSQLQAVTTALKIIASSQSEKKQMNDEGGEEDGDEEPDQESRWKAILDATSHYEVIWDGFVESTAALSNRKREPLLAHLMMLMSVQNQFQSVRASEVHLVTKILSLKLDKLKWNTAIFDGQ